MKAVLPTTKHFFRKVDAFMIFCDYLAIETRRRHRPCSEIQATLAGLFHEAVKLATTEACF